MRFKVIFCCALLISLIPAWGENFSESFRKISVQHQGRLKPLDTYASAYLMMFSEKSKLDGKDSCQWLAMVWSNPEKAAEIPVFRIRHPEVLSALKIEAEPNQLYSLRQIEPGLHQLANTLHQLAGTERGNRSPTENQLVDLHFKAINFNGLRYALGPLTINFKIDSPELKNALGLKENTEISFADLMLRERQLMDLHRTLAEPKKPTYAPALQELFKQIDQALQLSRGDNLSIVPGNILGAGDRWSSVWETLNGQPLRSEGLQFVEDLKILNKALASADFLALENVSKNIVSRQNSQSHIAIELFYNKADFFFWSSLLYVLALLVVASSLAGLRWASFLRKSALGILWLGWIFHTAGLVLRMLIMDRPPVTNLYESVVFVGWTAVLCCLVLEHLRRDRAGLLMAATSGALLQYVGMRYAMDGDTMGMLVAVLNSKFWLTTHVITITIGYGTTFIAGLAAHVYLFQVYRHPENGKEHRDFEGVMTGMVLVSLFFTTLGTILGGIWADQSWGRFWGWDPKENGALLIVLWLLLVIHGRIAGIFSPKMYACFLALSNIVVAIAWFGVNLLNVGLHSYGFTDSIALNLGIFCTCELMIAMVLTGLAYLSEYRYFDQNPSSEKTNRPEME